MVFGLKSKVITEIQRFAISGTVGFAVDAGIVFVLTTILGLSPIPAQIVAFSIAVTATWLINRNWTFAGMASERWLREWMHYVVANSFGALVNNGVYIVLVLWKTAFYKTPVLAVAVGSIAGMVFNFLASKLFIFRIQNR